MMIEILHDFIYQNCRKYGSSYSIQYILGGAGFISAAATAPQRPSLCLWGGCPQILKFLMLNIPRRIQSPKPQAPKRKPNSQAQQEIKSTKPKTNPKSQGPKGNPKSKAGTQGPKPTKGSSFGSRQVTLLPFDHDVPGIYVARRVENARTPRLELTQKEEQDGKYVDPHRGIHG